jgi:hypothetical protein
MTERLTESGIPPPYLEDRAREMLDHSSDSVQTELDHTQGWLREVEIGRPGSFWQAGTVGGLGALANAWGRLTLWSRANGTYPSVRGDLDGVMDQLIELRQKLIHGAPEEGDAEVLRGLLERMRKVHQIVKRGEVQ